jgi:CRISPR system Cascade subunit CasE
MSALHLVRLRIDPPALMRFAADQGLLRHEDDGHGYTLHAWLAAMFGPHAPQPFRFFERRSEILGYAAADAARLASHAQTYAMPTAWAALQADSLASKPMRHDWSAGERLQVDVLACPVSRKDGYEKDVFLRALDRLGDDAPARGEVYVDWFRRQLGDAVAIEQAELMGFGRRRLLRRDQRGADGGARPARSLERPFAEFRAVLSVAQPQTFSDLLRRGLGRHRAFGFGMVLLSPPV